MWLVSMTILKQSNSQFDTGAVTWSIFLQRAAGGTLSFLWFVNIYMNEGLLINTGRKCLSSVRSEV